jgi:hypothetical protein
MKPCEVDHNWSTSDCSYNRSPRDLPLLSEFLTLKASYWIRDILPPQRTLNTSRGIIRYRDEYLDNLSDEEICKELAPQGVIHVKRFITKRNGQLVKLKKLKC